ncbi:unnamed protein product [Ectocarpus sp. CCAP 1310/34]|nr:unnamed protein product [Ectocarpus sp. CCAP 1310/34]
MIENGPGGLALKVESADLWHRLKGHINSKSLDILRKAPNAECLAVGYARRRPGNGVNNGVNREVRISYSYTAKGEFPDVAHKDGSFGFAEYAYAAGTVQPDVPKTIEEARESRNAAQWIAAAEREIANLTDRKVYKLVLRSNVPQGRRRINSRWVTQSVRVVLCITVEFDLIIVQMDVTAAFLHADIQEETLLNQEETRRYQGIVGCLMYLAQILRYDIIHRTMLYDALMAFKSGLQSLTAQSTMEAELVAAALAMKEAVFCSNILTELGFGKEFAQVPLYCDNTATLHSLGNRSHSSRTKHIALRFFFIRDLVSEGKIFIHFVPTDSNPADIGTKHLNKDRFQHLLNMIKNFNVNDFINSKFK